MDEVRMAEIMPDLGASIVKVSSDAARRFCDQGQSFAKTISEWNMEASQFVSHRLARNSETLGRMAKCPSLPEILAIQNQWVREAADDYMKQTSRLMEVNGRMMGGLLRSFGQVEVQSAEQTRSSTAKVPMRATS